MMNFIKLKDFMDFLTSWRIPGNSVSVCLDGKEVFSYSSGYVIFSPYAQSAGKLLSAKIEECFVFLS